MNGLTEHLLIYHSSSATQVYEEMERLDDLFRNTHKRAPEVEMFISTQWHNDRPFHSLSVYFDPRNRSDMEYLMSQTDNNQKDS